MKKYPNKSHPGPYKPSGATVLRYLDKFPDVSSAQLGRKLRAEHPLLFKNAKAARDLVGYYRGAKGDKLRAAIATKKHMKQNTKRKIKPFPKSRAKPWPFFHITGVERILVLADAHVPWHDQEAINIALDYADGYNPDCILLNGDWWDCVGASRWIQNPEKRDWKGERKAARDSIEHIHQRFPKVKRLIWKMGNHEERVERFMWAHAAEIYDSADWELSRLLRLDEFGVEIVKDKRRIKAGKLNILHGHELKGAPTPVNFARTVFLKCGVNTLASHKHQSAQHTGKRLDGKIVNSWSTGCLCEMHPDYAKLNNWSHGFATIDLRGSDFHVNNIMVCGGKLL